MPLGSAARQPRPPAAPPLCTHSAPSHRLSLTASVPGAGAPRAGAWPGGPPCRAASRALLASAQALTRADPGLPGGLTPSTSSPSATKRQDTAGVGPGAKPPRAQSRDLLCRAAAGGSAAAAVDRRTAVLAAAAEAAKQQLSRNEARAVEAFLASELAESSPADASAGSQSASAPEPPPPPAPAWRAVCEVARLMAPKKEHREPGELDAFENPLEVVSRWLLHRSPSERSFLAALDPALAAARAYDLAQRLQADSDGWFVFISHPAVALAEEPEAFIARLEAEAARLDLPLGSLLDCSVVSRGAVLEDAGRNPERRLIDTLIELFSAHLPSLKRPARLATSIIFWMNEEALHTGEEPAEYGISREDLADRVRLIGQLLEAGDPNLRDAAAVGFDSYQAGVYVWPLLSERVDSLQARLQGCRLAAQHAGSFAIAEADPLDCWRWEAVAAADPGMPGRRERSVRACPEEPAWEGEGEDEEDVEES
ncbi:hypothetical protein HYH03_010272 [Edaphochlamys debaryana]|uniref:Uncharacterized protein n=1 Tax=Edaphochlamys debaryana TaxID=47281 RepID=A0A836BXR1_9CHLO|nr:hypothetical protein HYH03_010272 [Edaphochlamys debaryana]|eukprot:KAG2491488.1 hypothetical protein HYH03_010272 [Edaphochlamys debaryana]